MNYRVKWLRRELIAESGVHAGGNPRDGIVANGRRGSDAGYNEPAWPERERALRYREQAARFDQMAVRESRGTMRDRLVDLARQYRGLAESLEAKLQPKDS